MNEYRVGGANAYAPLPVRRPSRLPEEPKKQPKPEVKKARIAPFTVMGVGVALVLLFCVIFSYARLFEVQNTQAELKQQRDALLAENERLRAEYENGIDLDEIAKRAEQLGMHLPQSGQIQSVWVDEPAPPTQAPQDEGMNVFEAFQALFLDLQAYFS